MLRTEAQQEVSLSDLWTEICGQPQGLSLQLDLSKDSMRLGIVIYSDDPETVWNAFRLGNFALQKGDEVKVFLLAKGVESESLNSEKFKVIDQMEEFISKSGKIYACGTCLKIRNSNGTSLCPLSTMKDLYELIKGADKVISF